MLRYAALKTGQRQALVRRSWPRRSAASSLAADDRVHFELALVELSHRELASLIRPFLFVLVSCSPSWLEAG